MVPVGFAGGRSLRAAHGSLAVWNGGDEGTRTPDPRDANAVLSQLSYIPTGGRKYTAHRRGDPFRYLAPKAAGPMAT